jgi:pantoate--beta-alanine ligase
MEVIKSSKDLKSINFNRPLAFVPTMGNLHEGHLSLIKYAKENYLEAITSIFITLYNLEIMKIFQVIQRHSRKI